MENRFEVFVTSVMSIYRCIQKLKNTEMASFGLKGSHVMCLFQLLHHGDGLSSAELCALCEEDKAAISRSTAELEERGLICRPVTGEKKSYRLKFQLTDAGRTVAGEINTVIGRIVNQASADLTDGERALFYGALDQIARNLHQLCVKSEVTAHESH